MTYRVPLHEIAPLVDARDVNGIPWVDLDPLLAELGRLAGDVLAPADAEGDPIGCSLVDGRVRVPACHRAAYRQLVDGGWMGVGHPSEHGGAGMSQLVTAAFDEILASANLALSMVNTLNAGAVGLLARHASQDQQRRWLPPLVAGTWTATMAMTEADAGSDLGAVRTRAIPDGDGYRLFGEKVFISFGDHDLTDQILHLVLARLPDAPSGSRGLSLFAVPRLEGPEGACSSNDVVVTSLERKVGLHASPTCALAFGTSGVGAAGELVGGPGEGLRQMFAMMNHARVRVALQGVAVGERALQKAEGFARERHQGRAVGWDGPAPIIAHADVRRMLGVGRAHLAAARALAYETAHRVDRAADVAASSRDGAVLDLLTPVAKVWCSDTGVEVASAAVQVQGGFGFLDEAASAGQQYRDVRVTPIYEGTNGILAIDLLRRQIAADRGATLRGLLDEVEDEILRAPPSVRPHAVGMIDASRRTWDVVTRLCDDLQVDARAAMVGATPLARALGGLLGGWLLVRAATADLGPTAEGRVAVYAAHVLPRMVAELEAAVAGIADLDRVLADVD